MFLFARYLLLDLLVESMIRMNVRDEEKSIDYKNMDTVAEGLKALDCKSSDIVYAGSNPARVICAMIVIVTKMVNVQS